MDPRDVLRAMVEQSGKSQRLISVEIGRHPTYVTSLLHGGSCPQVDTFASIAKACGCEVLVRFPEHEVEVEGWMITERTDAFLGAERDRPAT